MVDFLVIVPVLIHGRRPPGNGYHRRATQVGILQACSQISRTHVLRHTDRRPVGGPCITIGHIGRRLLGVGHYPADAHLFHLHQSFGDDHGHVKNVGNAVALHGIDHIFRPGHAWHRYISLSIESSLFILGVSPTYPASS